MIPDHPLWWRGWRVGVACGVVMTLAASCSSVPPLGAAFAVATAGSGETVTLHEGRGHCSGEARAAVWRPGPGDAREPIPGCWVIADGVVLVSFLDGERGNIPVGHLVKVRAS